jgi:hypothetical protein
MIAVVHHDYVFSFGVRGRTETRPKKSEHKNAALAENPDKPNDHFVTPRPNRTRRNIRAASDRHWTCPVRLDPGNTPGPVPPTHGSQWILEELD